MSNVNKNSAKISGPDYPGLVNFLVRPLLESPDSLSVDCEQAKDNSRVWIRLAFEDTDKGRVYGRGGRNLQAIRRVLATAASTVGQSLYLDVYEELSGGERPQRRDRERNTSQKKPLGRKFRSRRISAPKIHPRSDSL